MHIRQMDGTSLEEKIVLYVLSKLKTAPWKMCSEVDQGFFGNLDLVGGRLLLRDHEAMNWLTLNDYYGEKPLWVSNRKW